MGSYLPYLSIFLLPTVFPICDRGGTWSTWFWSPNQTGYDICGSCWKALWIRDCLSLPNCPCTEFWSETNTHKCPAPRTPCCPGDKLDNNNICINTTTRKIEKPPVYEPQFPNDTYCPPSGVGIWGHWTNYGRCSATCGRFGTQKRTRKCISEAYGCPCCNSDVGSCQTVSCPPEPCPNARQCAGALLTSYDGLQKYCYPFQGSSPTGSWSEWTEITKCTDTCGMFGVVNRTRGCFPSGSACLGGYWSIDNCPPDICLYPRDSCKDGYVKALDQDSYMKNSEIKFICVK